MRFYDFFERKDAKEAKKYQTSDISRVVLALTLGYLRCTHFNKFNISLCGVLLGIEYTTVSCGIGVVKIPAFGFVPKTHCVSTY
ncbi:MAG: hypothetical protein FWH18_11325 [Marinilabiliaceae bacterium]|nr:hypothetical protein [Marinilabiliaceae bacterium]